MMAAGTLFAGKSLLSELIADEKKLSTHRFTYK